MNFILKKTVKLLLLSILLLQGVFAQVKRNNLSPEMWEKVAIDGITISEIAYTNGNVLALKELLGNDIIVDYSVNPVHNSVTVKWKAVSIFFVNEDDNPNQLGYLDQAEYWVSNITIEKNNAPETSISIAGKNFTLSGPISVLDPFQLRENRGEKFFLFTLIEIPSITINIDLDESGTSLCGFSYDEF